MTPAKVNVLIAQFAYGGNGGISSTIPEQGKWLIKTVIAMKEDSRIDKIGHEILSDTPITMTRNRAVAIAQQQGFDIILMLDSDNEPDGYLGADPAARPFWGVAFDFAYERLMRGEPTVIAAPYCGPPPHPVHESGGEVPYLFEWMDNESDEEHPQRKLELLTRNEAARLSGIHPVAALPTGVCLFTTNIFEGPPKPYFAYEWNEDHSEKRSTEDVYCTRNLSLYWRVKHDIDVCFAACDSWALHYKPKKIGRPRPTPVEVYAKSMRDALAIDPVSAREKKVQVDYLASLPRRGQVLTHDQNEIVITDDDLAAAAIELAAEQAAVESAPVAVEARDPDYHTSNGRSVAKYIRLGGRKVAVVDDFQISEQTAARIESVVGWLSEQRGNAPLDVMVAHAGSGQSSAVIADRLAEGSHLYALDCTGVHEFSDTPAIEFGKSFAKELDSGRVRADLASCRFPWPEEPQHLDLVFIERFLTPDKLSRLAEHVQPGGILAGLGYETAKIRRAVEKFAEVSQNQLTSDGDVWAVRILPLGAESHE